MKLDNNTNNNIFFISKIKHWEKISLLVTVIFFVACTYIAFLVDNPSADNDLLYYYYSGKEILYGDREIVQIFNAPVGWPILLAFTDTLINDAFVTAKIFSVIFSTGIVFISYWIIRNFFGKEVALLGQVIIAVNPILHVEAIITHSEMLPVFLIFISFYFISKKELLKKHIIFCAIFLGLSFMLRPQSLFIGFGFLIFILFFIKRQKKSFIGYFILFFLLSISPLIIYNISTTNNIIDTSPNFYLSYESASNKEYYISLVEKENLNQSFVGNIIINFENYFENYFENLLLFNPHLVLNLGLGYNNFSTIPIIPFSGLVFVLGGIFGLFKYDFPKKYLIGIVGFSITLSILLFVTNVIETYFLLPLICPLILIGIFSFKKIPNTILRLLIISLFFMLFVSIARIGGAWDLFAILILPSAFSAFFIVKIIPKIITKIQNVLKIKSHRGIKFSLALIIFMIIISNLVSSFMIEKHQMYGEPVNYHNLLSSEKNYELLALEYKQIGEILSKELNIENKIVMANSMDYAYYAKSKFLFTNWREGIEEDTINSFISRANWSQYDIIISNAFSIPPDRPNTAHHVPDYLIYKRNVESVGSIQVLENPEHPKIPNNFELMYMNDKTGIVLYKIKR